MSFKEAVIVPIAIYEKYFPKDQLTNENSKITTVSPCGSSKKSKINPKNNLLKKRKTKNKTIKWINFEDRKIKKK